jgi:hypothetical protein
LKRNREGWELVGRGKTWFPDSEGGRTGPQRGQCRPLASCRVTEPFPGVKQCGDAKPEARTPKKAWPEYQVLDSYVALARCCCQGCISTCSRLTLIRPPLLRSRGERKMIAHG